MKILPAPLFPGRAGAQPSDAAAIAAERSDSQAARFADFGMFGAKEKKPESGHAALPVPPGPVPETSSARSGTRPAEAAGPPVRFATPVPDPLLRRVGSDPSAHPLRHAPAMPRPGEPGPPAETAPATPEIIEDEAAAETGPPSPERRHRPEPPIPSVRLTVHEENGVVELIAGSGPIDADSRVLLRRLVEAMLARSGLALAHFRINGARVAPIPYNRGGQ